MLYELATCEDKALQWVDNVFHDLMHEKPIGDRVVEAIIDWLSDRTDGPVEPSAKKAKTAKSPKTPKSPKTQKTPKTPKSRVKAKSETPSTATRRSARVRNRA